MPPLFSFIERGAPARAGGARLDPCFQGRAVAQVERGPSRRSPPSRCLPSKVSAAPNLPAAVHVAPEIVREHCPCPTRRTRRRARRPRRTRSAATIPGGVGADARRGARRRLGRSIPGSVMRVHGECVARATGEAREGVAGFRAGCETRVPPRSAAVAGHADVVVRPGPGQGDARRGLASHSKTRRDCRRLCVGRRSATGVFMSA